MHMYAESYMVYVAMIELIRWSYIDQNGGEEFLRPTPTKLGFRSEERRVGKECA